MALIGTKASTQERVEGGGDRTAQSVGVGVEVRNVREACEPWREHAADRAVLEMEGLQTTRQSTWDGAA